LRKRVFETIVVTVARFFETRKWKDVIIFKLILLAHNLPDSQTSSEANGISTLKVPEHQTIERVVNRASDELIGHNFKRALFSDNRQKFVESTFGLRYETKVSV